MSEITNTINFTPEQEAAIKYRGGSLLVSAAAGSGKTKVLVERLLSRIDDGDDIDEFLVITYTRAAAFELRERIYEEILTKLASSPGNARLRRQSMLCKGASIDTIHTFCAEILRENAHLVGLPPDFRVADESESGMIMNEVIDTVLNDSYKKAIDNPGFSTLIETVTEGRDDKRLVEIIFDVYKKLQSTPAPRAWISNQLEKLSFTEVSDIADTDYGTYSLEKLRRTVVYCHEEMQSLREEMKQYPDFEVKYAESIDNTIKQIEMLVSSLDTGWDEAHRNRSVEFLRPKPIKGYDELKEKRTKCNKILKKCATELECSSQEHITDMKTLAPAMTALLELVLDFDIAYCEEKRKRGAADFFDLEHLVLSLLLDKNTGKKSEIAVNLSKRYKEIMVDEYQDVNAVQELIFNAISDDGNNIFMVGDVKQSIYRFRLADPSIFLAKYNTYAEYNSNYIEEQQKYIKKSKVQECTLDSVMTNADMADTRIKLKGTKINLSKNFRSCSGILEAINHIFTKIMSVEFGELDYTEKESLIPGRDEKKGKQGKQGVPGANDRTNTSVDIDLIDYSEFIRSESEDLEENPRAIKLEAEHIADRIKNMIDSSYMIPDGNGGQRPVTCSDIVILLRSIKGRAWQFASALSERGIQTEFPGSEGFFETIEITAILALLAVIDNPMQDIPLAAVLCGPVYKFTSNELAEIRAESKGNSYYRAVRRSAEQNIGSGETSVKCRKALDDIEELRTVVADMPSDRFIWHVYRKTRFLELVGAMNGGEKRQSNLILLTETARRFESSGYKGLFSFLVYMQSLQERGLDIFENENIGTLSNESTNAVRIMSIHKSKGLEFPVVYLANTSKRLNFQDIRKNLVFHKDLGIGSMLIDKERRIKYTTFARTAIQNKLKEEILSEELRVLYVAMTRARDKLVVSITVKDAEKTIEKYSLLPAGKIAPQVLSSMSSIAEWILAAVLGVYERGKDTQSIKVNIITTASTSYKQDVMIEAERAGQKIDENKSSKPILTDEEQAKELKAEQAEELKAEFADSLVEELEEELAHESAAPFNFDYKYPYPNAPDIPSKMTVTGLSSHEDPEAEKATWVREQTKKVGLHVVPAFIAGRKKLTAAERGTLLHHVMQHIDYDKGSDEAELLKELQSMVMTGKLEETEIAEIDIDKILRLFKSAIGVRMISAKEVKREFKFSLLTPVKKYFPNGENDKVLLQGIIDCYFEEDGEIVVVDFKTDRVTAKTVKERAQQYTPQLKEYANALERITGKRVKERVIYFFEIDEAVTIGDCTN